jgi:hypothetical protein
MPRSYRFDHFTAQSQTVNRNLGRRAKQRYSEATLEPSAYDVQYGHRFAQTEARLHQRAGGMSRELPEAKTRSPMTPIGALPGEEPQEERTESWRGLWAEGERAARSLAGAGREARSATARLVRLPLSAFRVAAVQADRLRRWAQGERPWS